MMNCLLMFLIFYWKNKNVGWQIKFLHIIPFQMSLKDNHMLHTGFRDITSDSEMNVFQNEASGCWIWSADVFLLLSLGIHLRIWELLMKKSRPVKDLWLWPNLGQGLRWVLSWFLLAAAACEYCSSWKSVRNHMWWLI